LIGDWSSCLIQASVANTDGNHKRMLRSSSAQKGMSVQSLERMLSIRFRPCSMKNDYCGGLPCRYVGHVVVERKLVIESEQVENERT
jgi:hypothetical protein